MAEYLLDYFRELAASGCFVPAYPSAEHHPQHASQLRAMAGAEIDAERRLQMHALLGLALSDAEGRRRLTAQSRFQQKCEATLLRAARLARREGSAAAAHAAAFAERSHIFREPKDLDLVP